MFCNIFCACGRLISSGGASVGNRASGLHDLAKLWTTTSLFPSSSTIDPKWRCGIPFSYAPEALLTTGPLRQRSVYKDCIACKCSTHGYPSFLTLSPWVAGAGRSCHLAWRCGGLTAKAFTDRCLTSLGGVSTYFEWSPALL